MQQRSHVVVYVGGIKYTVVSTGAIRSDGTALVTLRSPFGLIEVMRLEVTW